MENNLAQLTMALAKRGVRMTITPYSNGAGIKLRFHKDGHQLEYTIMFEDLVVVPIDVVILRCFKGFLEDFKDV